MVLTGVPTPVFCTTVGLMSDLTRMLAPLTGGQFPGWPASEAPTVVQTLVVLIGIPLIITAVVLTLTLAGSLARRGRGVAIEVGEPLWLGQTASPRAVRADTGRAALTTGPDETDTTTGGASVRW